MFLIYVELNGIEAFIDDFSGYFFQLFTQATCEVQVVSIETGFEAYMEIVI